MFAVLALSHSKGFEASDLSNFIVEMKATVCQYTVSDQLKVESVQNQNQCCNHNLLWGESPINFF